MKDQKNGRPSSAPGRDTPASIRLRIVTPEGALLEKEASGASIVIGRSSRADIPVPDPSLSREHARLSKIGDTWFIEDVGSRNGTYLEGLRLEKATALEIGQTLRMGGCVVSLEGEGRERAHGPVPEGTVFRPATELLDRSRSGPTLGRKAGEEELRRYAERLKLVFNVQQSLARSESVDELLENMLARVFDHLKPEQGAVFLKNGEDEYRRAANRSVSPEAPDFVLSRNLIREVAGKGLAALTSDVRTDERFAQAMSMVDAGVRSLVAAPLLGPEGSLGMIALSSSAASRTFTEEDMELLVSLASVAALRLRNISLAAQAAERERLEAEVALARRIQLAILPDRLPEIETLEMYGQSIPSSVTSGDFYKAFSRAEGQQCVLFLADVSGKGLPAALVTGALEALSAGPLETGVGPAETFNRISQRLFVRTPPEKYATAFLAIVDTASGEISYANAGHNAALVLRESGGEEWLDATGPPLGLLPGMEYGGNTVKLAPGDALILYTDGITEASDAGDNEFGRDRMAGVFAKRQKKALKDWAEALERELLAFTGGTPFADDRTLLMVRRRS